MGAIAKPFIVPVFIPHAGCPQRCIFCDQRRATGHMKAMPSDESIHTDITNFLRYRRDERRWTEISFYGGNFLGLEHDTIQSLLNLASTYVRQEKVHGIRFSTRPDTIDPRRLQWIADFPVTTIELGVQSMNNRVLKLNRRGHSAEHTQAAMEILRQHTAYRVGMQIMIGLAGDTFAEAMRTGRLLAAMAPDFVRIYPTMVLKDSTLAHWYAQGRYKPLSLEESIAQTKELYKLFSANGIRIIRMGLQPTSELNPDAGIAAGPFHPAFGELVLAALWQDALIRHLTIQPPDLDLITISVHPHCMSQVKGQKNKNIEHLIEAFHIKHVAVQADGTIPPGMAWVNGSLCSI